MGNRSRYVDCLRAVAVLLVLFHHAPRAVDLTPAWIKVLSRVGWSGVDLFFVLSGFLVSGLLFREYQKHGDVQLGRFLIRRGLKIYPSFYLLLATTVVVGLGLGAVHWWSVLVEAIFVQNYFLHHAMWLHTWSLAVEEHFYFLLGLGIYLRTRWARGSGDPFQGIQFAFVGLAATCLIWRIGVVSYAFSVHREADLEMQAMTHFWTNARVDSLFLGVMISWLYHFHAERLDAWVRRFRWPLLFGSICLTLVAVPFPAHHWVIQTVGFSLIAWGYGGILLLCVYADEPSRTSIFVRPLRFLALIGSHSYGIYLWHVPIVVWLPVITRRLYGRDLSYSWSIGSYFIGAILVGILTTKLVELPFLALRDRFIPSRGGDLARRISPRRSSGGAPTSADPEPTLSSPQANA